MAIHLNHKAEARPKRYQSPSGAIFFEIDCMSYGPDIVIHTNEKSHACLRIGKYCSIAEGATFFTNAEHHIDWASTYPFVHCANVWTELADLPGHPLTYGDITVGNDVWIGAGAMIRSGVSIGHGAVVAMGAVVTQDVPAYAVVGGVPAKLLRYRFAPEIITRLEKLAWWHWPLDQVRRHARLLNCPMDRAVLDQLAALSCKSEKQ